MCLGVSIARRLERDFRAVGRLTSSSRTYTDNTVFVEKSFFFQGNTETIPLDVSRVRDVDLKGKGLGPLQKQDLQFGELNGHPIIPVNFPDTENLDDVNASSTDDRNSSSE